LLKSANEAEDGDGEDEQGEDLFDRQFSLAFGAKILLNTTCA